MTFSVLKKYVQNLNTKSVSNTFTLIIVKIINITEKEFYFPLSFGSSGRYNERPTTKAEYFDKKNTRSPLSGSEYGADDRT